MGVPAGFECEGMCGLRAGGSAAIIAFVIDWKAPSFWDGEGACGIIQLLNYLTSEPGGPTMSSSGEKDGRDACGTLAKLWRLIQTVMDDSEPALEALGLSAKAFFLLEAVGDCPFPAELARRMHLPPPTVTYLVKQLEAKGFLERRAEAGDLRKFRLVRTPAGKEALTKGGAALGEVFDARLRRLAPDEVASFDRTVSRLARPGNGGA